VLESAYRAGARFDSWEDQKKMDVWAAAFAGEGLDPAEYLGTLPVTARLPWDHLDVGLEDGFLLREYRKALKDQLSLPCGKAAGAFVHATNLDDARSDGRKLVCYDCGIACDLDAMREQRLVYLRKLGADERRPPAPAPRAGAPTRRPPARPTQGEPRRYRFVYEKLGAAAYLSHLDLIRALPRAFRRLELPLYYSGGFHPKPDMTFGPALSLGVASLCEVVDVKIAADIDAPSLLAALSAGAQPGLRFTGGAVLGAQDAAINRVVDTARYAVGVPRAALEPRGGESWLRDRIERALEASSLIVVRRIDGIGKRVEVRAFLRSVAIDDEARNALAEAGLVGGLVPLAIDVEVRGSGGVKVAEVIEAVCGDAEVPHRAVRVALGARAPDGIVVSPLALAELRARRVAGEDRAQAGV
jgi:radical SAM-linked protein